MDPLASRKLGRTGIEVTQLGFGGAGLGDLFDVVEDADASATLQAAWDAGIRYYDTSPWYGRGQSEHRFGRALYRRPRADFVISTKVGRLFRAFHNAENFEHGFWRGGLKFQHRFDYSYDGVMRSFEDSLQRLGLPRIDLLLIHDLDIAHHVTEAKVAAYLTELHNGGFRALAELKQAGLIGGIGAGINELGMMPRFLDLMDIDFFLVALPYTLLDTDVLDSEFPRCVERGVGFVIGAPFASGILATGAVPGARYRYADSTSEILAKVGRIEAVCTSHRVPLPAAALQFPLGHPSVAAVIPGALLPEQIGRHEGQVDRADEHRATVGQPERLHESDQGMARVLRLDPHRQAGEARQLGVRLGDDPDLAHRLAHGRERIADQWLAAQFDDRL